MDSLARLSNKEEEEEDEEDNSRDLTTHSLQGFINEGSGVSVQVRDLPFMPVGG